MTDDPRRAHLEALKAKREQQRAALAETEEEIVQIVNSIGADAAGLTGELREQYLRRGDESMGLHVITKPAKVSSDMVDTHRVALSRSAMKRSKAPPDVEFMECIQAAGYTQVTLADAVDIKQPTLSAHRRHKDDPNSRPIPTARAEKIQRLTKSAAYPKGWPADAAHWPCGLKG